MKKKCDDGLLALSQNEISEINRIQLGIFKYFINVCKENNLKYYAVHGTLLGAVMHKGFFPFDDDIDVAMPRKDYDKLIKIMQADRVDYYYMQCNDIESDYPLVFGKMRNSKTAFIQPILNDFNINKGIYIDIFPIDFCPRNKFFECILKIKGKICTIRIADRFEKKKSIAKELVIQFSKILIPKWNFAMKIKNRLYSSCKENDFCMLYGGKTKESKIRFDLFGNGKIIDFEDIKISIPEKYEEYLNIIYTDYKNYNPAEKLMRDENMVEVSANIIDTEKSYIEYIDN